MKYEVDPESMRKNAIPVNALLPSYSQKIDAARFYIFAKHYGSQLGFVCMYIYDTVVADPTAEQNRTAQCIVETTSQKEAQGRSN